MKKAIIILILPVLLNFSCSSLTGEEVARFSINKVSIDDNFIIKEIKLDLIKDDEIYVWSEMNFSHQDNVDLRFKLVILKDGEKYGSLELDPIDKNISIGEVKTTVNGKTNWRFSGKNSEIKIKEDGLYTFKAILVASENPSLVIRKAELVFKM